MTPTRRHHKEKYEVPFEDVARRFNERNGEKMTADQARAICCVAMKKIRRLLMGSAA